MFIENFFLIHHLKDILLSLIEISEILIEKILEMKFLNKTGLSMNLKIQIWYGLTGKQIFLRVVNSHAPIRTKRAKLNNLPWIRRGQITVEITQQIVLKVIING